MTSHLTHRTGLTILMHLTILSAALLLFESVPPLLQSEAGLATDIPL